VRSQLWRSRSPASARSITWRRPESRLRASPVGRAGSLTAPRGAVTGTSTPRRNRRRAGSTPAPLTPSLSP